MEGMASIAEAVGRIEQRLSALEMRVPTSATTPPAMAPRAAATPSAAQDVLTANHYKAVKQLTDMVAELRQQNARLAAANAEMETKLAAMEGREQSGRVQYSTAAARMRAQNKNFSSVADWPGLGAAAAAPQKGQFDSTMFTEVARHARSQFRATQYVAGGPPGQQAQAAKKRGGLLTVPAPRVQATPIQPDADAMADLIRWYKPTAVQTPKAYTEAERKAKLHPARTIKPGKPVKEWDVAGHPEAHRRVLTAGLDMEEAHQQAVQAIEMYEELEAYIAVLLVPAKADQRGRPLTNRGVLRALGWTRKDLAVPGCTMTMTISAKRGMWMMKEGGTPQMPGECPVVLQWERCESVDVAEREEKEREDKEAKEYEESMQPVPRTDGYSKMVLSMEPAALETATNTMARGNERMSAEKREARPKATTWVLQQATEVLAPMLGGRELPAMSTKRKGNMYEVYLLLPTDVARQAMRECGRRQGWGIRPHVGDYQVDQKLQAQVMRIAVPDEQRRTRNQQWQRLAKEPWFAGLAAPDTWFRGDQALAVRRWGAHAPTPEEYARVSEILGCEVKLPVTTLRVRGYCTLFKSSPEYVDRELVRVFGAGHGVRHVSTQQEHTSRGGTVYIVKVTGVRPDWEGKRIVESDVHATEKRWERTEQVRQKKPYEPVRAGMRLQVQQPQEVKPTIDQDVPLPRNEEEAAMDADAAENDDEEDIL